MIERVSVVGLGKLGSCIAACIASKGMQVIGVDVNEEFVAKLNAGVAPVIEPQLSELIIQNRSRLTATTNLQQAVLDTDATMIIVPTPSQADGRFSVKYVAEAATQIAEALRVKDTYHLVVLTSTVLPGGTQEGLISILETSGKQCGQDFGVCYNPEFIALGSVIRDLLNPDFVLIGESDEKAGSTLEQWYAKFCDNRASVARMNIVNAELTKVSLNTYVTMKITFANTLAMLCERLPGADVDIVSNALGRDSRIGRPYLTGALGYGGPCFPRDNNALAALAHDAGSDASMALVTDRANRGIVQAYADKILSTVPQPRTIGILGLAYKPDTNVVEESQAIELARLLTKHGRKVVVFDPLARQNAEKLLGDTVRYADSIRECVAGSGAVVITNPSKEFRSLVAADLDGAAEGVMVFDCWRILRSKLSIAPNVIYVPLGVGERLERQSSAGARTMTGVASATN